MTTDAPLQPTTVKTKPEFSPHSVEAAAQHSTDDAARRDAFLADLTNVCAKHGIGITGDAVLFVMEPDDFPHHYSVDAESRLYRR